LSSDTTFSFAPPLAALAAEMLSAEITRLTGIPPHRVGRRGRITLETAAGLPAEAYRLESDGQTARVLAGDALGFVFGVGALLAECVVEGDILHLPRVATTSAPQTPIRGMWMASHRQSNSYFAWGIGDWERYLRSLMLWGMNVLGAYPAHMATWRGVVPWGPQRGFASPQHEREWERFWQAEVDLCHLARRLGLPYYAWVPPNDIWPDQLTPDIYKGGDNACPSTELGRRLILQNREELFRRLPHVDVLFVPSHDNGGCPCPQCTPWVNVYLPLVREQAEICRRYHPQAKVWLSTQHLSRAENEVLFQYLRRDEGSWVDGVVFGPWSIADAEELRRGLPEHIPLINYPDITHALRCQNPIRGLDYFTSKVFERDGPTTRPRDIERIWRRMSPYAVGSVPYSEGIHDDLNKVIWLQLGWDGQRPVREVVERYCRRWFGHAHEKEWADLLYALEEDWMQPLEGNQHIPQAAAQVQALVEEQGRAADWRAQMFLVRTLVQEYAQKKLRRDQMLEQEAMESLAVATSRVRRVAGAVAARLEAGMALPVDQSLRDRIMQVVGRLQQEPGMRIESAGRLDFPMNESAWILPRLRAAASAKPAEARRLIDEILHWDDPGPGGHYEDGGNPAREPHLVLGEDYVMESMGPDLRHSQTRMAYNFADTPGVIFEFPDLDPTARYRVRVTYVTTGRMAGDIRLLAGPEGQHEIHGPMDMPRQPQFLEWPIPREAYANGRLRLQFVTGGKGRGPLVPELWLIREG